MFEKEKTTRSEVLEKLDINEDILDLYEQELEIFSLKSDEKTSEFSEEDVQSLKILHQLRDSGLTSNEIKLLATFSDILKKADFEGIENVKELFKLSPIYRLKQTLKLSREEIKNLKAKLFEIEDALKREYEEKTKQFNRELEAKQKAIDTLDGKLSETLSQKSQIESQLAPIKAELESKQSAYDELGVKQKALETLENKLAEVLKEKSELETQLASIKEDLKTK